MKYRVGLIEEIKETLENLAEIYESRGDYRTQKFIATNLTLYRYPDLSRNEAKAVIDRIINYLSEKNGGSVVSYPEINSGKIIERRLRRIENELTRLSSNPALEKKVAKLEEDLRKIRVDSIRGLNGDVKEQKNQVKKFETSETKVFVIMPFDPIFDDIWNGGIKRACNSENMGCIRVDKIDLSTWITDDIKKYLGMADIVITDITGNNPNVMFELGWALAKDKKQIVIRQLDDPNRVPFDVKDIRYISYTNSWSGIEKLCNDIRKFIKSTSESLSEKPTRKKQGKRKT
jgi:polyhydroxyalkanoate synthesis regulator phasin